MSRDFTQWTWNATLEADVRRLTREAVQEDLDRTYDWTTVSLAPPEAEAAADVVARKPGVIAGLHAVGIVLYEMQAKATWIAQRQDGDQVAAGDCVGVLRGSARDLLTAERTILNLVCRLSGVATTAAKYVAAIAGTKARIYDTRKTTPGWRRLEKYAVRCGGACNHRTGLYDAILIKDNHLALGRHVAEGRYSPGQAVDKARAFLQQHFATAAAEEPMLIEIEVDSLDQFRDVLPHRPDIVLLDNMSPAELRQAVEMRAAAGATCELEASGGINLDTIRSVAESGVDRISVGAMTHSAPILDLGLDWEE